MTPRHGQTLDTLTREGAIVIADLAKFTETVVLYGPEAALRDIWTVRRTLIPIFRDHRADVYKVDADNLYIFAESANDALVGSLSAHAALARQSRRRTRELRVCIGIGFGTLLYLPSEDDYYGEQVNLASKLGEDVAHGGQTLLTLDAEAALSGSLPGSRGRRRRVTVSGVSVSFREWIDPEP